MKPVAFDYVLAESAQRATEALAQHEASVGAPRTSLQPGAER